MGRRLLQRKTLLMPLPLRVLKQYHLSLLSLDVPLRCIQKILKSLKALLSTLLMPTIALVRPSPLLMRPRGRASLLSYGILMRGQQQVLTKIAPTLTVRRGLIRLHLRSVMPVDALILSLRISWSTISHWPAL